MKELDINERPREKAKEFGVASLSNRELLALILRGGCNGLSATAIADDLLSKANGLANLQSFEFDEIIKIKGIKSVKALELLGCFELSKRMSLEEVKQNFMIDHPEILAIYLNKKIGFSNQEKFIVIFLDTKNQIIKERTLFVGTLDRSIIHPREIFQEAVRCACAKIICSHNHPSGDCNPSQSDIEVTQAIYDAGALLGIPLIDHIIVGKNNFLSFKSKQLIFR